MRLQGAIGIALIALPLVAGLSLMTARSQDAVRIDPPAVDPAPTGDGLQKAVLAGGCFWGVQAVYQHTKGVSNAVSGYAGGSKIDADYITVGTGRTRHAEAVAVTYDPRVVSFGKLLQIFFSVTHDPTQLNRQGPDYGPQYRSEIFPQTAAQRDIAKAYIAQLDAARVYPQKIVTRFNTDKQAFYPAEDYHQDYATKHPTHPYIVINDRPKVENLKAMFPDVWRETPVTVAQAGGVGH